MNTDLHVPSDDVSCVRDCMIFVYKPVKVIS